MVQGTGSHVGKSLIVAGLCRAYARRGLRVRPFKPQNMSNNAAVARDGGEIGRAQALQARACFAEASRHMNPVLLKPDSERGAQVVVQGQAEGRCAAAQYRDLKPRLLPRVLESFERVAGEADLVLVEGAGSPAEINLRAGDIANMGFAEAADLPVLLVGDIDRGGVIASLVGTVLLLDEAERGRLRGFVVNKFRGDPALFEDGVGEIERRTGLRSLGVVPWFDGARRLPAEDSVSLDSRQRLGDAPARAIKIAVPRLPRIANFDDFDPLAAEPGVSIEFVPPGSPLPAEADAIVLPGSKATLADLAALRAEGWDIDIRAHVRRGRRVLGICGGFQMLGRRIADPHGVEGAGAEADGLGLLEVATTLAPEKTVRETRGHELSSGAAVSGYEIHAGRSEGPDLARPMLTLDGRPDGARSADGRVEGCYLHGLFASAAFRHAWLSAVGGRTPDRATAHDHDSEVDAALDALAAHLAAHLDLDRILAIAQER